MVHLLQSSPPNRGQYFSARTGQNKVPLHLHMPQLATANILSDDEIYGNLKIYAMKYPF